MTKFILHGGKTTIPSEKNEEFFREIVKDLKNPTILLCYFAREKDEWPKLFEQDQKHFRDYTQRDDFKFILANEENFTNQIEESDVIYLRGGDIEKLKETILKFKTFPELIKNKVVMGSSAGFYILAKYYYSPTLGIQEGLGILPIKAVAHFDEAKKKWVEEIENYKEYLEIIAIPEADYIVRNL